MHVVRYTPWVDQEHAALVDALHWQDVEQTGGAVASLAAGIHTSHCQHSPALHPPLP